MLQAVRCRGKARRCRLRWRCLLARVGRRMRLERTSVHALGILAAGLPSDDDDLDALTTSTHSLTYTSSATPAVPVQLLHSHTHAADDEHDVAARPRPG